MTNADDPFLRRPEEGMMRPAEPSGFPGSPWDDAAAGSPVPTTFPPAQPGAPTPPPFAAAPVHPAPDFPAPIAAQPGYAISAYPPPIAATQQYPAYGAPATGWSRPDEKNWMGVVALIAGIAGFFIPLVGSVTAIIFGHLGRAAVRRGQASNGGMSLAGLILGYLVTGFFVLGIVLSIALAVVASTDSSYSGI